MAYKVILDAGHGGKDSGAVYEGRMEKDDVLQLAMAVADILEQNGIDTAFTRTGDVYQTPFEKAQAANAMGGDLFVSLHRNAYVTPNTGKGVETLVFQDSGTKAQIARAINQNLSELGFENRGVTERPKLVVLKRTKMPAILVEAGFIDNDADNALFDEKFYQIAEGIARGIIDTVNQTEASQNSLDDLLKKVMEEQEPEEDGKPEERVTNQEEEQMPVEEILRDRPVCQPGNMRCRQCEEMKSRKWYRVQVGAFRNQSYAQRMLRQLLSMGYPAYILFENEMYKVQVGSYRDIDNAAKMEECLRAMGYSTYIRSV